MLADSCFAQNSIDEQPPGRGNILDYLLKWRERGTWKGWPGRLERLSLLRNC